jgi:hypothetical protein
MALGLGQMLGMGLLSQFMGGFGNNEKKKQLGGQQMRAGAGGQQGVMDAAKLQALKQQGQVANNQQGFMGGLSGISNSMFKGMSPEQVARLGMGFNAMTLNPNAGLQASFQKTIDNASLTKGITNAVIALRKMGRPHLADLVESRSLSVADAMKYALDDQASLKDNTSMLTILRKNPDNAQLMDLADILEADPSMNTEVWKAYMDITGLTGEDGKTFALGVSEIMTHQGKTEIDPVTKKSRQGQHYQIQTDKATGDITKVWLDSYGETLEQKDEREKNAKIIAMDETKATEMGHSAQDQAQDLMSQVQLFEQALQYVDDGALSGWLQNKLVAIDDRTALLRGIQNKLGISVINSATFGALSEREMQMAMATNLNLSLPPAKLRKMILEQIRVRRKLAMEFNDRALMLLTEGDGRYSTFAVNMAKRQKLHNAVVWEKLRPEEITALMAIGIDREAYKDKDYTWRRKWFDARTN